MNRRNLFLKIVLPILIICAGGAGMYGLLASQQPPPKEAPENLGALIEVVAVQRSDHPVTVHATGTVQTRTEASITPQVSGRVVEIAPDLVVGGLFRAGELLFTIEDIDYRLAVQRAEAALTRAELELQTVEGQARIARLEWQRLKLDDEREPNPLVLYQPQLKNAQANVASAEAQLAQARLDLQRTHLSAPFNSRISSEQIDIGQYLRAGTSVAVLAGTDVAEVIVPLPVEELGRLKIPRAGSGHQGSEATVRLNFAERSFSWSGTVVRSLGEVDPRGRMTRVVVAIADPYNLHGAWPAGQPPLEPGMFVEVELTGDTLGEVIAIPRSALRGNATVWVAGADDLLQIRPVDVVRREEETLLVRRGLDDGERLIITPLSGAAEGMKLRIRPGGEDR